MAKKKPQQFWKPRLKPLKEQCASCPFREDNNKEWGEIVQRLWVKMCRPGKVSKFQIGVSRFEVMEDVRVRGDFACHCTVYDEKMNQREPSEYRQCPGATAYYLAHQAEKGKR